MGSKGKQGLQGTGSKPRKSRIALIIAVSFPIVCGAIVGLVLLAQKPQEDSIGIPANPAGLSSATEAGSQNDPIVGLLSENEEDQVKSAEAILGSLEQHAKRAPEIARALNRSRFPKARILIVQILGRFAGTSDAARASLAKTLTHDLHYLVRLEAARCLRKTNPKGKGAEALKTAFVQALGDQEDDVCMEAMRFAFDNPDRKSTKPLVSYLGREDAKYRWKAVEVLGRIRDPEAAPVLLGLLQDETLDVQTRSRACGVLAMLGHKPAEPVIQKMAKQGSDSELTRVARESLKLFKEK